MKEKIEVLEDVIAHVRRRKTMYLGREEVIPENLITALVNDALTLGTQAVEVRHRENWWMVSSEEDWLIRGHQCTVEQVFKKLVPLAGAGPEVIRNEVLLAAFASIVFTRKGGELIQIVGTLPLEDRSLIESLRAIPVSHRVIGFAL